MTTTSSELQLTFIKRKRQLSSELCLSLGADDIVVNAGNLHLPLTNNDRPNAGELPLPIGQDVIGDTGSDTGGDTGGGDTDPPPATEPRLLIPSLASCFEITTSPATTLANCLKSATSKSIVIANDADVTTQPTVTISRCQTLHTLSLVLISNCYHSRNSTVKLLADCQQLSTAKLIAIQNCMITAVSATQNIAHCQQANVQPAIQQARCEQIETSAVEQVKHCLDVKNKGVSIASGHDVTVQPAIPVPCRYYPLPPPTIIKPNTGVCRLRPPSSDLPLMLGQRQVEMPASDLPLNLTCWHDTPAVMIAKKDTYIMHTIITATIGGIAVEPLSFSIATDMNSYCWSGTVGISPDDYAKIESKLNAEVGNEPIISVIINNHQFDIIAEKVSRTREFVSHKHNIWGRSATARLGADYAVANDRLFDQGNFASQIVGQQLQNMPIELEAFAVDDWFIPANSYSVSNKTPIAVIADIADAVGGYVESHYYEPKLSIKKKWKVNAWELATATPDVTIPATVIVKADDSPIHNPRYNTVTLMGDSEGFSIYRQSEGRDQPAPTMNNDLFTDQNATIPKGSAVLSETGKHNIYQLKMPWSDEIPLAELGQIWQVNDLDGNWRGVVTGVSIEVTLENDAPCVWQTATVDRYLDK